jgi:hypothetical protein
MKDFPTLEYYGSHWGIPGTAFRKLDGSNIRVEYSRKRGFYKFGTRTQMIGEASDTPFTVAIDLFREKYETLARVLSDKPYRDAQSVTLFLELHGEHSAFGQHDFNSKLDITLFDVWVHKRGFVAPKQFIKDFEPYGIADVVYEGNLNIELVTDVKNNVFNLEEGVIFKSNSPINKAGQLYYCKIKTNDWFDRLRASDDRLYQAEMKQANR